MRASPAVMLSECWVHFELHGTSYMLLTPRSSVRRGLLVVEVLGGNGEEIAIKLPVPTSAGRVVTVPSSDLSALPPAAEESKARDWDYYWNTEHDVPLAIFAGALLLWALVVGVFKVSKWFHP